MTEIIGKRVLTEEGDDGIVLAIAHPGGGLGTSAWQFLLLREDGSVVAGSAINAKVKHPGLFTDGS